MKKYGTLDFIMSFVYGCLISLYIYTLSTTTDKFLLIMDTGVLMFLAFIWLMKLTKMW
jgi:hypothetical protein